MADDRPYHWRIQTNHGWIDAIGHTAQEAVEKMHRTERLLNPRRFVVSSGKCERLGHVSWSYWRSEQYRREYREKLRKIAELCSSSSQVIRVAQAIGVDTNDAVGYWGCNNPHKKNVDKVVDSIAG